MGKSWRSREWGEENEAGWSCEKAGNSKVGVGGRVAEWSRDSWGSETRKSDEGEQKRGEDGRNASRVKRKGASE
eukprot:289270-Pleurochrysis_carterae.AAC.1